MKSVAFLVGRLGATSNTQQSLSTDTPPWVWKGMTVAQWLAGVTQVDQLRLAEIEKRAAYRAAAATYDLGLSKIQVITRDVKREGVYHFRAAPDALKIFRALRTDAEGRDGIFKQGELAHQTWADADETWTYDDEVPISVFGSRIASSLAERTVFNRAFLDWRRAESRLMTTARAWDKDCVMWYAAATRKFKKGTEQGDTIRSTVPTTYTPPPPVGQAVISNIMVSGAMLHFDCSAPHATRYIYLWMKPGSPVFEVLFSNSPLTSITLNNVAVGLHRFKAIPRNCGGEGQESEVVEITVAAEAAA